MKERVEFYKKKWLKDHAAIMKSHMRKVIPMLLTQAMAKYNMKQKDLVKLVGVRKETIGNLVKGIRNLSL